MTPPTRTHRPKHAPRVPFALLVGGLVVGGMCALLGLNTAAAANELTRHNLATKDSLVSGQVQQLQNQVAASAAPGALASAAAALGMVPAGHPAFLQIGTDGKVRLLGSPASATAAALAHVTSPHATSTPPATTKKAKPTSTVTKAAKSTPTAKSSSKSGPTATSPRPTPTPTPTPTPITTLPGGTR